MYNRGSRVVAMTALIGAIIVSSVIVIGAWTIAGDDLPKGALITIFVAGAVGVMWGLFNLNFWNSGGAGLEWMYALGVRPASKTTVSIVKADSVCPRGFSVDDVIEIKPDGRLSNPMCRAAVEALRTAIVSAGDSPDFQAMARCDCPVGDTHLTFATDAQKRANYG